MKRKFFIVGLGFLERCPTAKSRLILPSGKMRLQRKYYLRAGTGPGVPLHRNEFRVPFDFSSLRSIKPDLVPPSRDTIGHIEL